MGEQFRMCGSKVGKRLIDGIGDATMEFAPAGLEQSFVGDVADQSVLELESGIRAIPRT